jgi:putative oxidoreductase
LNRALPIPQRFHNELETLARVVFGFLIARHGMEQWFAYPEAAVDAPARSLYGVIKFLSLPGGILLMLGVFVRPVCLVLAPLFLIYWLAVPVPAALAGDAPLFGARGPSDPLLLNAFFLFYLATSRDERWGPRALAALRIVAGWLFLCHGLEKIFNTRVPFDPISLRGLAALLENVGGPMLMLGLFTRPLAFLLSGEMAVAYFMTYAPRGLWESFILPTMEAAILNCFLFLFFWASGPGAWSLDGLLVRRRPMRPAMSGTAT